MVLGTIILLGGVFFFSFIMGSIIGIIEDNSTSLGEEASKKQLNLWITSL